MTLRLAALLVLLVLLPVTLQAQTRAWLERERIADGETTTLNIETDGRGMPDYAPLLADFDLSGHSSRQQVEWSAGRARVRSVYAVALRPRRIGELRIPPVRVGAATTQALLLRVTPAPAPSANAGRDVFVESEPDDRDPYVQQSVGWVVRAHAAVPLIAYELTQQAPTGATILQVGGDVQYRRTLGSRTYTVIERRYTLVPERPGTLTLPAARFQGQAVGGFFDRLFGDGRTDLAALAPPRLLQVRAIPANAPQPWLPLHRLALRYVLVPGELRAGAAAAVVVELDADGTGAAQLPPLAFGTVPGAQVFAERPVFDESVVDGRPRVRLTQRFSIVPTRAGALRLPGPSIDWWDVGAGTPRRTLLPAIEGAVLPGATADADTSRGVSTGIATARPGRNRGHGLWLAAAALLALGIAAVGLWRRRGAVAPDASTATGLFATRRVADVPLGDPRAPASADVAVTTASRPPALARLLELGDLADIETALRAAAPSGPHDLDAVIAQLDDAAQREAVVALRAARWAGGDPASAREALRRAFARGPSWHAPAASAPSRLPPLYPDR
ncbi:BatD family protein [Lysobacter humi (ex Lee et al. 2017)]